MGRVTVNVGVLVLKVFGPPPPPRPADATYTHGGYTALQIDGVRANNNIANLEWVWRPTIDYRRRKYAI